MPVICVNQDKIGANYVDPTKIRPLIIDHVVVKAKKIKEKN